MFVSINWIKDYVDLEGLDIKKLIESFTLATAEVEDIIEKGADVQNVVVGEILSVEESLLSANQNSMSLINTRLTDLEDVVEADITLGLFSEDECPHCDEFLENPNVKICPFCGGKLEY